MRKICFGLFCVLGLNFFLSEFAMAELRTLDDELSVPEFQYHTGVVTEVFDEGEERVFGVSKYYQVFAVKLQNGFSFTSEAGDWSIGKKEQSVVAGDRVLVRQSRDEYRVLDHFRLNVLGLLFAFFVLVIVLVGRRKGVFSLLGLMVSIFLIIQWLIPEILSGQNIMFVSVFGGAVISSCSLYLSHGFSKQTTISLVSIILVLALALAFSSFFVWWGKLFGLGTEESVYLQYATSQMLDLRGLFLGGVIIGTIGVLDDVTTTQVAVVQSLKMENRALSVHQLFSRAISVGRTHIASLVNTLALAYTGAALPLFLLFHVDQGQPWWVTINSEFFAEEIVRALCGSIALVLAVPISTFLAAVVLSRWPDNHLSVSGCGCCTKESSHDKNPKEKNTI